jgi:GDP-L-fucose synthase
MGFWSEKRVAVTGGAGFLGSVVVRKLLDRGCDPVVVRSADYDLRTWDAVERMYRDVEPDVVVHLAASVGGIGANQRNPGSFFYENLMMGVQLMELARLNDVEKFVAIGTICAYPRDTPVPFRETDLWNGYPEETNAPYGLAKKMLLVQSQAYREQYGFRSIYLLPVNLYGPGDNFDLETSHVIPAMIRKLEEAKSTGCEEVVFWGDGSPTREFLFVDDAAEGITLAAERYDEPEPVNLGTGVEVSISDLANTLKPMIGYEGRITWDTSRPNGQPRRCLDVSRARERFGFEAKVSLEEGLLRTIDWYRGQLALSERRYKGRMGRE